jgi:hypothetical protein
MLFIVRIIWNTQIHCVGRVWSFPVLKHVLDLRLSRRCCWRAAVCYILISCLAYCSSLKVEAMCSSETSVEFNKTTQRYIPENTSLQSMLAKCFNLVPCLTYLSTLIMEAIFSSKTSNDFHRITWRYIPEDLTVNSCGLCSYHCVLKS